jgi:hypothetical protein
MNPDTPQFEPGRGEKSAQNRVADAAESDLGSVPLGTAFDAGLGPAELSDETLEGRRREKSGGFVGTVKERAASQLNAQKVRATDQLDNIAQSVRQSTRRLRDENHEAVAAVLERGVNELERFTTTLRERDINEFLADLERFGRRQPALFLGSSLLAGVLLARFSKASDEAGARRFGGNPARPSRYNPFSRPEDGFAGQESL